MGHAYLIIICFLIIVMHFTDNESMPILVCTCIISFYYHIISSICYLMQYFVNRENIVLAMWSHITHFCIIITMMWLYDNTVFSGIESPTLIFHQHQILTLVPDRKWDPGLSHPGFCQSFAFNSS